MSCRFKAHKQVSSGACNRRSNLVGHDIVTQQEQAQHDNDSARASKLVNSIIKLYSCRKYGFVAASYCGGNACMEYRRKHG